MMPVMKFESDIEYSVSQKKDYLFSNRRNDKSQDNYEKD